MASAVGSMLNSWLEWVTLALDSLSARAVVFGVPIGGHFFLAGFLLVVTLFLVTQKIYKPTKKPLSKKEIDELCEEWVPELLIPPFKKDAHYEPPVLESAAGPHTTINGKEVVNFASANYLGLLGTDKLLVRKSPALLLWKNMVLVPVTRVVFMGLLARLDPRIFMMKG